MRTSGRAHWIIIALVALAALLVAVFATGSNPPTVAAQEFLTALAKADDKKLADLSYFNPPRERDAVITSWRRTLYAGQYFRFTWTVKNWTRLGDDRASVAITYARNADTQYAYQENFNIDMMSVKGQWKVDVRSLSRELYPFLPR